MKFLYEFVTVKGSSCAEIRIELIFICVLGSLKYLHGSFIFNKNVKLHPTKIYESTFISIALSGK